MATSNTHLANTQLTTNQKKLLASINTRTNNGALTLAEVRLARKRLRAIFSAPLEYKEVISYEDAHSLLAAFTWNNTEEGTNYWANLAIKIRAEQL